MLSDYPEINLASSSEMEVKEDAQEANRPISSVQVDGLVVLKILAHARESLPHLVTGQLLGMGNGSVLECTHCYPFIQHADVVDEVQNQDEPDNDYQLNIMKLLREVNIDSLVVGWYSISVQESYHNSTFIETMFTYQQELGENCVCIIFDPLRSLHGKLYMKALRLKPEFMKMYKDNTETQDFSQGVINQYQLTSADIFQEVPLTIHNNLLTDVLLWELGSSSDYTKGNTTFENVVALDRVMSQYQTNNAQALLEATENIYMELGRYASTLRKRNQSDDDRQSRPSRLETMYLINQINTLANHLKDISHISFESISLCQALQTAQTAQ
eukprot:Sspe_Gene.63785::Locus_36955_Transcript_1_2_Confidence_0.500_Length_1065::g.63785::m.63785/K03247/EIF3H; translation initiation factor 3 subunit H